MEGSGGGPRRQDDVENVFYVIAMVRDKATPRDGLTYGWRVLEMGVQGAIKTW